GSTLSNLVYVPPTSGGGIHSPGEFLMTDQEGNVTAFYDLARNGSVLTDGNGKKYGRLDGTNSYAQQPTNQWIDTSNGDLDSTATDTYRFGAFKGYTDASGNYTITANYDGNTGNLQSLVRTDGSGSFERYAYTYAAVTNVSTTATDS